MKASELIAQLQKRIDKHGDLKVFSTCAWDHVGGVELIQFQGQDNPVFELVACLIEEEKDDDTETKPE